MNTMPLFMVQEKSGQVQTPYFSCIAYLAIQASSTSSAVIFSKGNRLIDEMRPRFSTKHDKSSGSDGPFGLLKRAL